MYSCVRVTRAFTYYAPLRGVRSGAVDELDDGGIAGADASRLPLLLKATAASAALMITPDKGDDKRSVYETEHLRCCAYVGHNHE